jgi:hypothetical protein
MVVMSAFAERFFGLAIGWTSSELVERLRLAATERLTTSREAECSRGRDHSDEAGRHAGSPPRERRIGRSFH